MCKQGDKGGWHSWEGGGDTGKDTEAQNSRVSSGDLREVRVAGGVKRSKRGDGDCRNGQQVKGALRLGDRSRGRQTRVWQDQTCSLEKMFWLKCDPQKLGGQPGGWREVMGPG